MIGNERDARYIRNWYIFHRANGVNMYNAVPPEGWTHLGSGCYRAAYLSPDGVVYKVQHTYQGGGGAQSNQGEAEALRRYWLTRMPDGCRLPRYQFFELEGGRTVMAMERFTKLLGEYSRYEGEGARYYGLRGQIERAMPDVYDFNVNNLAIDEKNDLLVPIDLAG